MLVEKWMTKKVITVDQKEALSEAINILKRNKIRRMPVLDGDKLVGIVSDRDLKEASPSKATSLDIWELHYLMTKIKVKDIMTRNPITIEKSATVERAAMIMHDRKIGGLPVVEGNELVGIITEQDIFEALINITGARIPSYRVSMLIDDSPGSIKEMCDVMREVDFKCVSILTTYQGVPEGKREVILRFQMGEVEFKDVISQLRNKYGDVQFIKEEGE
ncbi:MAG: CBS domain-containing protein [Ignavibacteria bacterium]|nr:MAG: CBS domain-containing protein [Ignavibacteria bacterium]